MASDLQEVSERRPRRGERIELLARPLGVSMRGTVFYADQLQMLIKWDDGRSQSPRTRRAEGIRLVTDGRP